MVAVSISMLAQSLQAWFMPMAAAQPCTMLITSHAVLGLLMGGYRLTHVVLVYQIKRICPYANLSQAVEVPLLISASQDDQRVPFLGISKWLQRLRMLGQGRENAILLSHPQGGHFGYQVDLASTISKEHAFLMHHLCPQT